MAKELEITLEEKNSLKLSDILKESGWNCRESIGRKWMPDEKRYISSMIFCSGVQLERPFEELELNIRNKEAWE